MTTKPLDDPRFGPCLRLTCADAEALVALRGAQVLSWRAGGAERLFLAADAPAAGAAPRGGIPVIFPQFAQHGPGLRHGFARTATWRTFPLPVRAEAAVAGLRLVPDATIAGTWPHPFVLELSLALTRDSLELVLEARNPGPAPWAFAAALHTYLAVHDTLLRLPTALAAHPFADRSASGCRAAPGGPLDPGHEIERLYRDVPARLDWALPAPLRLESDGWPDLMVWNPGTEKAAALRDLAPGDHHRFLCVEPLRYDPQILPPGGNWRATHRLAVPPV